jgi:predicted nucleic acid-binding Zn ribbon protein
LQFEQALIEFAGNLGITRKLREYNVITWEEIVGEQIAKVATPQRIENGVLHVSVPSAPWRAELTLRRHEIITRINGGSKRKVIQDIRFR